MWDDIVYEPGELKVVAYDTDGRAAAEKTVRTAGKAYALKITEDRWNGSGCPQDGQCGNGTDAGRNQGCEAGDELVYLNVSVVDRNGNPVPTDSRLVKVETGDKGRFVAMANGDPTCLEAFHKPQMHLFNGQLTVIVTRGTAVKVSAKGLRSAELCTAPK